MQGFPSSLTGAPTGSKRENRVLTLVWDLGTGQKGVTLSGCSCFIVSEMWVNTEQIMEIKGSKIGRWLCWSYWWVDDADVGSGGGGNSCWRLSHPPHTSCLRCWVSKTYLSFVHSDSFWESKQKRVQLGGLYHSTVIDGILNIVSTKYVSQPAWPVTCHECNRTQPTTFVIDLTTILPTRLQQQLHHQQLLVQHHEEQPHLHGGQQHQQLKHHTLNLAFFVCWSFRQ